MTTPFNLDPQKWQLISQDAEYIVIHYPPYGRYPLHDSTDVLETALYIGLDAMKDEIIQHQTLEWIVRERNNH